MTWAGKLLRTTMTASAEIRWRLAALILGILVVFASIVVTALISWQHIGELQKRLTQAQKESFRIADHFQTSILDLNNSLLQGLINPAPAQGRMFQEQAEVLNKWLDEQFGRFGSQISPAESAILSRVDEAYDVYLGVATNMLAGDTSSQSKEAVLLGLASVRAETDHLLGLGMELAGAHRDTLNSSVAESTHSLANLRLVLLSSLLLLLLFGAGLATVTFRDLIAPLRVKLVESNALLERQEKLASLGMLAAGVAHEVRNPLTAIKARLFTQRKALRPGSPEQVDAEVIGQEINRLERIVRDVLRFARPSEPEFRVVPATAPLREVESLLADELRKANITITVEHGPPGSVRIDLQQIKQVLINLVQNAAESIGRNGRITLRTCLENVRLRDEVTSAVVMEVADTGTGITPEVEKRLFDPFFTTKDSGTGLGLPIAGRIVEKNGGALRYQTQVGRGTTFGIVLPRVATTSP